jgi:hypothetical protein
MDLMDLFTPLVSEETQHPNFRTISKYTNTFNQDVLNDWARGFKDRDGKFVKEFQRRSIPASGSFTSLRS